MVSGERVAAVDQFHQPGCVDMSIDLSGCDIGVAKKRLEHPQIGAPCQQMRGKGMAKHMWADAIGCDSGQRCHPTHQLKQANAAQMRFAAWE